MVKKLLGVIAIIGLLTACSNEGSQTTNNQMNDDTNDAEQEVEKESENNKNQSNSKDVMEDNQSNMEPQTGSTETLIRNVEGRDQEVKVINYEIQPYAISYRLDEMFGVPEVKQNQITYSIDDANYHISLEIIEHTTLENAVSNLQERFETEGYDESFDLEDTPTEENALNGKMQFFDYPIKGFIAYEVDEHVLAITFRYPVEGGDSMYPLLGDLRKSIHVQ
ncbi:hypothetical protein [Sporosarcina cyprini]|uniref:hypothetical protein n=1 Tax=Sporosarcina cyprini TaxID=2910523 RepID=UPI001EDF376E|nr:hypothetical protein [Sporosarcina cyprini]MCG3088914.1 hypothetical protein [Sporosarcina cyprini]